jgi:hypothetical protein
VSGTGCQVRHLTASQFLPFVDHPCASTRPRVAPLCVLQHIDSATGSVYPRRNVNSSSTSDNHHPIRQRKPSIVDPSSSYTPHHIAQALFGFRTTTSRALLVSLTNAGHSHHSTPTPPMRIAPHKYPEGNGETGSGAWPQTSS